MNNNFLKLILLDFDGTVIDSNNIKDDAFNIIFNRWPNEKDEMIRYHLANNHIDRKRKFNHIVKRILKIDDNEDLINELLDKFSKLTYQKIIKSKMKRGAHNFIKYFYKIIPIYLVSATPNDELKKIIYKMGLNTFFKKIYGAPLDKKEIFKKILKHENIKPAEAICIGDSQEDFESAKITKIPFVQMVSDRKIRRANFFSSNNFHDIKRHISSNYELK